MSSYVWFRDVLDLSGNHTNETGYYAFNNVTDPLNVGDELVRAILSFTIVDATFYSLSFLQAPPGICYGLYFIRDNALPTDQHPADPSSLSSDAIILHHAVLTGWHTYEF